MSHIAETFNEYGTPVTMFRCDGCGGIFTVCPAVAEESRDQWAGCLAVDCVTYDQTRDAEKLFEEGKVHRVGDRSHLAVIPTTASSVGTDGARAGSASK